MVASAAVTAHAGAAPSPDVERILLTGLLRAVERSTGYRSPPAWAKPVLVQWDTVWKLDPHPDTAERIRARVRAAQWLAAAEGITIKFATPPYEDEPRSFRCSAAQCEVLEQLARTHGVAPLADTLATVRSEWEAALTAAVSGDLPDWWRSYETRLAGQLQERVPIGIGIAAERLADGWRDWLDGLRGARAIAAGMTGYERLVSERALGHSKRIAELRGVVASHLVAADPQWRDVAAPAPGIVLAAYGVRRIPSAIDVAGPCRIEVDGSRIDVARLEGLTRIPAAWASALASAAATATIAVVTTIENETSAWSYIEERGGPDGLAIARELVLYTSGFASTTGAEVLRLLHAAVPSASFRHWGDADPHGFRIWLDLARRSGAPLRWWRTTAAWVVAAAARQAGAAITGAERRALVVLAEELPATDLDVDGAATAAVAAILGAGCKIEQEAFEPVLDAS